MRKAKKELTVEGIRQVAVRLTAIHREMTYLATLTPEQRALRKGMRIGPKKLHLLQERLEEAQRDRALLPKTVDLPALERATALTVALFELITTLEKIIVSVDDTLCVVGDPAVVGAAAAKRYVTVAKTTARRLKPPEGWKRASSSQAAPAAAPPAQPDRPAETAENPAVPTTKAA